MLGRTVFIFLVNTFTIREGKRKSFVDYMLSTLIYDNVRTLDRFVSGSFARGYSRQSLLIKLTAVEWFFKCTYTSLIAKDSDISHSLQKFLLLSASSEGYACQTTGWDTCLVPYQVLDDILQDICTDAALVSIIHTTAQRLQLHTCHLHRPNHRRVV